VPQDPEELLEQADHKDSKDQLEIQVDQELLAPKVTQEQLESKEQLDQREQED